MFRYLPALCAVCILSVPPAVQAQAAGGAVTQTTKSGVYSREQANRGQDVFLGMCKNCHTPEAYTTPAFTSKWNGKALSDLYAYIRDQMPKNEPGTLTAEEYTDVLAYLLRLNRQPAGPNDLPADPGAMKSIRFVTPIAPPSPASKSTP
jgi:S-disulfanyl-L-cysteine oxidoreductase SoxD